MNLEEARKVFEIAGQEGDRGPLYLGLQNSDWRIRREAVRAFAAKFPDEGLENISELLKRDPIPAVRRTIGLTLGKTLANYGTRSRDNFRAFRSAGPQKYVQALLTALKKDSASTVRSAVATGLAEYAWNDKLEARPEVVQALTVALQSDDVPTVRRAAAGSLFRLGGEVAAQALVTALKKESDPRVRVAAAGRVRNQGFRKFPENLKMQMPLPLIAALQGDPAPVVRQAAATTLGGLTWLEWRWKEEDGKDARAVEPLAAALADPEACVRRAAAIALGRYGDSRAEAQLIQSVEENASRAAVESLAICGGVDALAPISGVLLHPVLAVRREAARCIGVLAEKISGLYRDGLNEDGTGRASHSNGIWFNSPAVSLEHLRGIASESLLILLSDSDSELQSRAIDALGALRENRAVEMLRDILGDERSGLRQRRSSAAYLGHILDHRAIDVLMTVLSRGHSDVRFLMTVASTLVKFKDARVQDCLAQLLERAGRETYLAWDSGSNTHYAVAWVLACGGDRKAKALVERWDHEYDPD